MVDVHIIVLAEQSSPILAVRNGGARYQVLFPSPFVEAGPHARLNWMNLLLFGLGYRRKAQLFAKKTLKKKMKEGSWTLRYK